MRVSALPVCVKFFRVQLFISTVPPPVRKENHPLKTDMFEDKNTILKRQSHRMNLSLDREEGNGTDLVAAI